MRGERITVLERALALKTEEHGADSQQLSHEHGVLGNLLGQTGRFAEALWHLERALALHRSARNPLGEPYEHLVAASMVDVATCHSRMGRHEAALGLLREAVALEERLHGPDHKVSPAPAPPSCWCEPHSSLKLGAFGGGGRQNVADTRHNMGVVLKLMGDEAGGSTQLRHALRIYKRTLAPEHPLLEAVRAKLQ